jgi:hypothetical protein
MRAIDALTTDEGAKPGIPIYDILVLTASCELQRAADKQHEK